jgi:hypothetical protein
MTKFSTDLSELKNRQRLFQETFFYRAVLPNMSPFTPPRPKDPIPLSGQFSLVAQWPPSLDQISPLLPTGPSCDLISSAPQSETAPVSPILSSLSDSGGTHAKRTKKRLNFTSQQRQLLMKFISEHPSHPYADRRELEILAKQTNLTRKQVQVFMTNARMRKFSGNNAYLRKRHREPVVSQETRPNIP